MKQIEWSTEYYTGIELVDTQNKCIVDMLNLLFELHENEPESGRLCEVFRETIARLRAFFHEEEQFYQMHAWSVFDEQCRQHRYFLEAVDHLGVDALCEGPEASLALCEYLREWTVFHILHLDKNSALASKTVCV